MKLTYNEQVLFFEEIEKAKDRLEGFDPLKNIYQTDLREEWFRYGNEDIDYDVLLLLALALNNAIDRAANGENSNYRPVFLKPVIRKSDKELEGK
jgi:hypothetical protein